MIITANHMQDTFDFYNRSDSGSFAKDQYLHRD